jgi:ketosteroid isomerase-like protein
MPVGIRTALATASLLLLLAHAPLLRAQDAPALDSGLVAGPLFDELARMDAAMFDATFVRCDAAKANAIFADDVEFYHDKDGLSSGEQVRENTRRLTASCPREKGVTRTIVPGSLRVYPIEGYGAVQVGVHRFDERGAATSTVARFVSVWRMQDGEWRLARVLSLDHRSVPSGSQPAD